MNVNEITHRLTDWYGDGSDGNSPTAAQWKRVLSAAPDQPITLVNCFKLRQVANYDGPHPGEPELTGQQAFGQYATVSMPAMERAGGQFLHVGPFAGTFLGPEEDWDVIAIGRYPDRTALVTLFSDPAYRDAYRHRAAACAQQRVVVAINA